MAKPSLSALPELASLLALSGAGGHVMLRNAYRLDDVSTEVVATVVKRSTDAVTAANVRSALALSSRVAPFYIDVRVARGGVTLRGRVPSAEVKDLAGLIVLETTAFSEIRNLLVVDPMVSTASEVELLVARVAELELRTTLLEAMRSDPALRGVVPEVVDGKVTLYGAIGSELERQLAWEVARGLAADLAVEDRLRVLPAAKEAEGSLAELVELALHSSGAFDSDSGRIEVVEWGEVGVALQGSVRSRAEQLLAERLAREVTGIEGVVNELQVRADAQPK